MGTTSIYLTFLHPSRHLLLTRSSVALLSFFVTRISSIMAEFDVIVIGAGISGVNAGYRIQESLPDSTYAILESRHEIGGTWSLFKYPGIRSDSDLHTFGFAFDPWKSGEH